VLVSNTKRTLSHRNTTCSRHGIAEKEHTLTHSNIIEILYFICFFNCLWEYGLI